MDFLPHSIIKSWTGTPFRKAQIEQLQDWGYKLGRDFWIRKNGTLAVKSQLLQSMKPVSEVTEPDFSCFAQNQKNQ